MKNTSVRKTKEPRMPSGLEGEQALRIDYPVHSTEKRSEDMTARKSLFSGIPFGIEDRSPVTRMSRN